MLKFIKEKENCTGCGACLSVCPQNCISLKIDECGFDYPEVINNCIKCNKCYKVCPIANYKELKKSEFTQIALAGISLDDNIWESSTSGGAFTEICNSFCGEDDIIFGAKFSEDNKVNHGFVKGTNNIGPLQKSKYVQSSINNSYIEVETFLKQNKNVVFSGTPCQVQGLKNFLGKDYQNLLCIDLICHGVGSPGIFEQYINHLEFKFMEKVKSYEFRHKKIKLGKIHEYIVKITLENGDVIEDNSDLYNSGFLQGIFLRPSCGKCRFANLNRSGDITIGDLKNRYKIAPDIKGLKNLSTIIINSEKGYNVYKDLKKRMNLYKLDLDKVKAYNSPLRNSSQINEKSTTFFKEVNTNKDVDECIKNNIHQKSKIKKLWLCIPDKSRSNIKELIRCIKK